MVAAAWLGAARRREAVWNAGRGERRGGDAADVGRGRGDTPVRSGLGPPILDRSGRMGRVGPGNSGARPVAGRLGPSGGPETLNGLSPGLGWLGGPASAEAHRVDAVLVEPEGVGQLVVERHADFVFELRRVETRALQVALEEVNRRGSFA